MWNLQRHGINYIKNFIKGRLVQLFSTIRARLHVLGASRGYIHIDYPKVNPSAFANYNQCKRTGLVSNHLKIIMNQQCNPTTFITLFLA